MSYTSLFKASAIAAIAIATNILTTSSALAEQYSFVVHNKTSTRITKILVSQNGRSYSPFDIGKGIGAGKKVTLVWDESTNNESCKQWIKAVYADGSSSEPAKFDFCESDLEIEFED